MSVRRRPVICLKTISMVCPSLNFVHRTMDNLSRRSTGNVSLPLPMATSTSIQWDSLVSASFRCSPTRMIRSSHREKNISSSLGEKITRWPPTDRSCLPISDRSGHRYWWAWDIDLCSSQMRVKKEHQGWRRNQHRWTRLFRRSTFNNWKVSSLEVKLGRIEVIVIALV